MTTFTPELLTQEQVAQLTETLNEARRNKPSAIGHLSRLNMAEMMRAADYFVEHLKETYPDLETCKPHMFEMINFFNNYYIGQFPEQFVPTVELFLEEVERLDFDTENQIGAKQDLVEALQSALETMKNEDFKLELLSDLKYPAIRLMSAIKPVDGRYEYMSEISQFGTLIEMSYDINTEIKHQEHEEAPAPRM